jgi:hypothetical protein
MKKGKKKLNHIQGADNEKKGRKSFHDDFSSMIKGKHHKMCFECDLMIKIAIGIANDRN